MRVVPVSFIAGLTAVLTLTACAPVTRVIMLPQPGHDSIVEVTSRVPAKEGENAAAPGVSTVLLSKPYETVAVSTGNRIDVGQWGATRVKSRYGALLAAQPPIEWKYLLYFRFNGTQLTPKSATQLDDAIRLAMARPGNEIVVTGYTDSVGTMAVNDRLSLQRAQVIRAAIIARGFDRARVYAVGRGARDPLVPLGDQVAELKNRRVEITVR